MTMETMHETINDLHNALYDFEVCFDKINDKALYRNVIGYRYNDILALEQELGDAYAELEKELGEREDTKNDKKEDYRQ